jgi:3-oxoacyl-[acyl-carrier protein] reductase
MSEQKKIALITGASRGIGQAIARALAVQGAYVIGTATTQRGADTISAELADNGRGAVLDVSDVDSIHALMARLAEQSPAILVNNAAIARDNLLMRMKDDEWDAVIQTDLTAVYRLSKACLRPMMKQRWGRIISLTSVVGLTGNAGQCNYAAAKAGVIGFSKSLAREVGARGITVNTVAPGFIDTDMTQQLPDAYRQAVLGQIPLGRAGTPDDIAAAVCFLASNAASYITGETLHVGGGLYMP